MKEILTNAALALLLAAGSSALATTGPAPVSGGQEMGLDIPSLLIVRVNVDKNDEESAPTLIPVTYDKDVVDEATAQEALDAADQQGLEQVSLEAQAETTDVPQKVAELEDVFSSAVYDDAPGVLDIAHLNPWVRHGRFVGRGRNRGMWWGVGGGRNWGWYQRPVRFGVLDMRLVRVPARYGFAVNRRVVPFFHSPFALRRARTRYFFYARPW